MSDMEIRMRDALKEAMKSRDPIARAAIRSALSAIDNAGSIGIDAPGLLGGAGQHFAGSTRGLRAGDVQRTELSDAQVIEIVRAEVTNREQAIVEYQELGRADEADRLRTECKVLLGLLSDETGT